MHELTPSKIKFIKLGRAGEWEEDCIDKSNTLRLGFESVDHELALAKDWTRIREDLSSKGAKASTVSSFITQIRDFYESDESVLWITFYKRRLYWCFAGSSITVLEDKTKTRPAIDGWSCKDISGNVLEAERLSGKLLRVQGFMGTICNVLESEYVLKKINGQELASTQTAKHALANLIGSIKPLIQHLHWKDFEILVDLIFRQAGWQRVGVLGKTEKDIDLELLSPVLAERTFVQIKSSSDLPEFQEYSQAFLSMPQYSKMFYVVHTPTEALKSAVAVDAKINLLLLDSLAELTVKGGLVDWLIQKTS